MFLSAGLVLSGCGDDDTATTPAPAPPPPPPPAPEPEPEPEPEPPAPEAPATPTGLHVDEVTPTSITWHWSAVEGAIGYAVQFSLDEMFDDTDMIGLTLDTHFTATPVPPETNVYLRVAAGIGTPEAIAAAVTTGDLSGLVLSDWSTHVTGRTDMVPMPPPPPPTAVMATFTPPEGKFAMVPDDEVRPAHAMAMVNPDMMVTSATTAVITPMFIEGAAGVNVAATEDDMPEMPFKYVDWSRLQSEVIAEGATFMIQRTTVGANQEMEPTGDVAYVTCGPFRCVEGMDAPEFSIEDSAACAAFDPDLELQIGLIDNDFLAGTADATGPPALSTGGNANTDDGIDLGWKTSSSVTMTVKHVLSGVGDTYTVTGPESSKGSDKVLKMNMRTVNNQTSAGAEIYNENNAYTPGIMVEGIPADGTYTAAGDTTLLSACVPASLTDSNAFTYASTIGANHLPEQCFRLAAAHYEGYSVTVAAKDSEVSWGKVDWEDDPFADLKCDPMTFAVTDQVDVCGMFEDEVSHALSDGWGIGSGRRVTVNLAAETSDGANNARNVTHWSVGPRKTADPNQFKTLWFDDDLDGAIRKRPSDVTPGTEGPNDLYDTSDTLDDGTTDNPNIEMVWRNIIHRGAFRYGDFGKVDLAGKDRMGSVRGNDMAAPDGHPDNYDRYRYPCSDSDGEGCDAEWSQSYDVLFADGVFGCTAERTITISCEWDADGQMSGYRRTDHDALLGAGIADGIIAGEAVDFDAVTIGLTNRDTAGARTAGAINAFASCTVK